MFASLLDSAKLGYLSLHEEHLLHSWTISATVAPIFMLLGTACSREATSDQDTIPVPARCYGYDGLAFQKAVNNSSQAKMTVAEVYVYAALADFTSLVPRRDDER